MACLDILDTILPAQLEPSNELSCSQLKVIIVGGSHAGLACAATLLAAGMSPSSIHVYERSDGRAGGAGINFDDLGVSLFKRLGLLTSDYKSRLLPMRIIEERAIGVDGQLHLLDRSEGDVPLFAAYWEDVYNMLMDHLPTGMVSFGKKLVGYRQSQAGVSATFADGSTVDADLLIGADGPNSSIRSAASEIPGWGKDMRFAGYSALRGVVKESECPTALLNTIKTEYADFGNCLYFVMRDDDVRLPLGQHLVQEHAVFYMLGGGLLNWLIYMKTPETLAPPGSTTTSAPDELVRALKADAVQRWGPGLGGVIQITSAPFLNDIFDRDPLPQNGGPLQGRVVLVGDAGHPICPHVGKGTNMALHDALALAQSFSAAAKCGAEHGVLLDRALADWSQRRCPEHARCVLSSRHYGRLRTGMAPEAAVFGVNSWAEVMPHAYREAVLKSGIHRPLQWQLMPESDARLQVHYR